jgi:hypothetical protein
MDNLKLSMELKPIDRTDRGKNRLNAALSIYRETILAEAQNPERQILYWIDHSKDNLSDEFRCYAIQQEGEVIGYLQYSFFCEESLFFFEYLCIRDNERSGLCPSQAVKSIDSYLAQNYPEGFSIVFEVAKKRGELGDWKSDKSLIAYFKRLGFRQIDFGYRYPILQSYDGETSYPADLMVMLPNGKTVLSGSEMRTILRCLYFKHYLRWDRPFLNAEQFKERERLINALYIEQAKKINDDGSFGTRGDESRSKIKRFINQQPNAADLLARVFGPKLPRLIGIMLLLCIFQQLMGSVWLLIPFVLAVSAIYCLAEDTTSSRKLFISVVSRLRPGSHKPL